MQFCACCSQRSGPNTPLLALASASVRFLQHCWQRVWKCVWWGTGCGAGGCKCAPRMHSGTQCLQLYHGMCVPVYTLPVSTPGVCLQLELLYCSKAYNMPPFCFLAPLVCSYSCSSCTAQQHTACPIQLLEPASDGPFKAVLLDVCIRLSCRPLPARPVVRVGLSLLCLHLLSGMVLRIPVHGTVVFACIMLASPALHLHGVVVWLVNCLLALYLQYTPVSSMHLSFTCL